MLGACNDCLRHAGLLTQSSSCTGAISRWVRAMHVWSCTPVRWNTVGFSAASQCSLCLQGSFYAALAHSKWLRRQNTLPLKHRFNLCFYRFSACMCLIDNCIMVEKWLLLNDDVSQSAPSTVQSTQPSSTQDSFAKSNSPTLLLSLPFLSPLFSWPECTHCLHKGKWWLGCQRPHRWKGELIQENVGCKDVLLSILHCCSRCCFPLGHTPRKGS